MDDATGRAEKAEAELAELKRQHGESSSSGSKAADKGEAIEEMPRPYGWPKGGKSGKGGGGKGGGGKGGCGKGGGQGRQRGDLRDYMAPGFWWGYHADVGADNLLRQHGWMNKMVALLCAVHLQLDSYRDKLVETSLTLVRYGYEL